MVVQFCKYAKPVHILNRQILWASLVAQMVKNLPAMQDDPGSILRSGRSSGGGNGNPLQYSCLGNPIDRAAWEATIHGVAKSQQTQWATNKTKNKMA